MNINTPFGTLQGFQTTDGGYKYRRVQTVKVGSSVQTGLLEVESKFSTDGKGIGRLLVKVDMPYFTANTAACCCDESGNTTPTYSQAGKISYHTVITLPKAAIADIKSPNAVLAANQIAAVIGLCMSMSNTYHVDPNAGLDVGLTLLTTGKSVNIRTDSDVAGVLDPSRSVLRGVMGVTPFPTEGFEATVDVRSLASSNA
jgi:hypothetical protein